MATIVVVIMLIILAFFVGIQMYMYQNNMEVETFTLFGQVEQILEKNAEEKERVIADYNELCLHYADAVAYIISENPAIMDDMEELKKIAGFMQIDEIHIFDQSGEIVKGTQPRYYGLTVFDGEQIRFFAQMLEDKSLRLCQKITPNTAEKKSMQYAAVWTEDGQFIVQVGITPYRVFEVVAKNELSYIFSLLTTENGTTLYAVDTETGKILGSTDKSTVGVNLDRMGISLQELRDAGKGFYAKIRGEKCYCVATTYDNSVFLMRSCPVQILYRNLWEDIFWVAVCLTIIAIFMVVITVRYLNRFFVQGVHHINSKLKKITEGNLDERIDVRTTPEFEEVSSHINEMIKSILLSTEKMSYVLDHAMLPMGVYEYNSGMQAVRTTKQIKNILGLNDRQAEELFADSSMFLQYIEKLKENPVRDAENIYRPDGEEERYVRIETFEKEGNYLGMLIDVTESVMHSKHLKEERDIDSLTALYNRRGLEEKLDELFANPEELGNSAIVMLDADGLKQINDTYGHKAGDRYLCEIARVLREICPPKSVIARQGGDEFVLLYYGCESEEELLKYIRLLESKRDNVLLKMDKEQSAVLRYSFGYVFCYDKDDTYTTLIREADQRMYEDKKRRKTCKR